MAADPRLDTRAGRASIPAPPLATRGDFAHQVAAFARQTEVSIEQAVRAIVIELFSSVIADTPVDTGRARGNWQTSIGGPIRGTIERDDNTGPVGSQSAKATGGAIFELDQVTGTMRMGQTIYLTNNMPYILRLEFEHWSRQAPHGMMRKNVARINTIVDEVARGIRSLEAY